MLYWIFIKYLRFYSSFFLLSILPVFADNDEFSHSGIIKGRDTKGLHVSLISELTSIAPNVPFQVGLKIQHDPKFHTYWRNPGIVGVPTQLDWILPKGFTASAIHWPYPELTMMAGYPCYGYERDILLTVTITPPTQIKTSFVELKANARWMCCGDSCYPDFKAFSLTLPVEKATKNQDLKEVFAKATASVPSVDHAFSSKLLSKPDAKIIRVQITLTAPFEPILHLFNSDGQSTPDISHQLKLVEEGVWLYQTARSKHGPKSSSSFPFVLQTPSGYYQLTAK